MTNFELITSFNAALTRLQAALSLAIADPDCAAAPAGCAAIGQIMTVNLQLNILSAQIELEMS